MTKLLAALDGGHSTKTPGKRTPPIPELNNRVIHENEFNREVVRFLDIELQRCGFDTLIISPTDEDVPLVNRTNLANSRNADVYVSIHYNAIDGVFDGNDPEGLSVHVYPGNPVDRRLGECILKYLKEGTPQKNRGIVESNFHVLREAKMPSVLSENGFMDNKTEAMRMLNVAYQKEVAIEHAKGICEFFNIPYVPEKPLTPIMGEPKAKPEQMASFLLKTNPNPKINCSAIELATMFIEEGLKEGVKGDVAFSQSIHETGFFRYGGQVLPEQNNYAGIGATNNSPVGKGAWFDTPQIGVRAQIQHLKAYGSQEPLKQKCVDPRYDLVPNKGWATYVEYLGAVDNPKNATTTSKIGWAYPGEGYGNKILAVLDKILQEPIVIKQPEPVEEPKPVETPKENPPIVEAPAPIEPPTKKEELNVGLINKVLSLIIQFFERLLGGK